jgi:hypothetical protein
VADVGKVLARGRIVLTPVGQQLAGGLPYIII